MDELFVFDLTAWGVNLPLRGRCARKITRLLIVNLSSFGAFMGVFMASLGRDRGAVAIGVYPLWSVTMIVMYGLIINGLTVYGFGEDQTP